MTDTEQLLSDSIDKISELSIENHRLKAQIEEYYDFIQKKNEEDWKGDNVVGCLKLKIEQLEAQIERMKCCENCEHWHYENGDTWCELPHKGTDCNDFDKWS